MKAFISYSLNDSDKYILSILAKKLKEQGFTISSSYSQYKNILDLTTASQISSSNIFIGVISSKGSSNQRVLEEWRQAVKRKVPALLLLEDNIHVQEAILKHPNTIFFNRENPSISVEKIRERISRSRGVQSYGKTRNNNSTAWILGGIAALTLVGLLAADE